MLIRKSMKNIEIFNIASALIEAFQEDETKISLPVKVNFYLQKNMSTIVGLAQELEKTRTEIIQKYGTPSEDNAEKYIISEDKIEEATKEVQDLFDLEQEVSINVLKLDWFDNIDMSAAQVAAIAYMIEDEDEEE